MLLDKQFIFIIGAPRSGTTWLQAMLGSHPLVCTSVELTVFACYTRPWIQIWKAETANIAQGRWHAGLPFVLNDDEFYAILKLLLERVYEKVIATKPQATHILDKHPGYSFDVEDIHALLPHARFIHLIRDGRDVAVSMVAAHQNIGFGTGTIADSATEWKAHLCNARKASRYHGQYLEIRYEDLLNNGSDYLSRVFAFCELPISKEELALLWENHQFAEMKKASKMAIDPVKAPTEHYRKGIIGDWRQSLTSEEMYCFEKIAGDLLRELGYAESEWWIHSAYQKYLAPLKLSLGYRRDVLKHAFRDLMGPTLMNGLAKIGNAFEKNS